MNLVPPLERQQTHRTDSGSLMIARGLSASLGIRPRVFPSSDVSDTRPLPDDINPPFGQSLPSDRHVPPLWFLTTSTAYSAYRLRVCCTPKPERVRCVSRFCPHLLPAEASVCWVTVPFSRNAVHTLRRIPLASSRSASLRPLPSCCSVAS
jgi:hypothetical protein